MDAVYVFFRRCLRVGVLASLLGLSSSASAADPADVVPPRTYWVINSLKYALLEFETPDQACDYAAANHEIKFVYIKKELASSSGTAYTCRGNAVDPKQIVDGKGCPYGNCIIANIYQASECPQGYQHPTTKMCYVCPEGQSYNSSTQQCSSQCGPGLAPNPYTRQCQRDCALEAGKYISDTAYKLAGSPTTGCHLNCAATSAFRVDGSPVMIDDQGRTYIPVAWRSTGEFCVGGNLFNTPPLHEQPPEPDPDPKPDPDPDPDPDPPPKPCPDGQVLGQVNGKDVCVDPGDPSPPPDNGGGDNGGNTGGGDDGNNNGGNNNGSGGGGGGGGNGGGSSGGNTDGQGGGGGNTGGNTGGSGGSGGSGTGDGDGCTTLDCGDGTGSGSGTGTECKRWYCKGEETFANVLRDFSDGVKASPAVDSAVSFLRCDVSGSCPSWVWSIPWVNVSFTFDFFCLPQMLQALNMMGYLVLSLFAFQAFKWAFL